jgi:hypothetical protein
MADWLSFTGLHSSDIVNQISNWYKKNLKLAYNIYLAG